MRLGIIGGLGPMATAYFMELLINMTDAKCDQDHLEMIIYNCPSIPDRTAYILGKSNANPVVPIIKIGKKLKEQNVDCISIPCITAHYFHDEIEEKTGCKVIHAIRDTSYMLKEAGLTKIGIMATDGTIQSRIFQNEIEKILMPFGSNSAFNLSINSSDISALFAAIISGFSAKLLEYCSSSFLIL